MATRISFSNLKSWLDSQAENEYDTPYEIIITDAPSTGYTSNITRFVEIVGMEMESGVTTIDSSAFANCTNLVRITIPNGITTIVNSAFYHCTNLRGITIPNTVVDIYACAFSGCSWLTSVELPNSITKIGNEVFLGCSKLTNVIIPNSVTTIGEKAFYNCTALANISIPDSVYLIDTYAFYGCSKLASIVLPASITDISASTFNRCIGLTSVTIPNSVATIGGAAFYNCSNLTTITIPESVISIGNNGFYSCSRLSEVVMLPKASDIQIASTSFSSTSPLTVRVPFENLAAWESVNLSNYGFATGTTVESIEEDVTLELCIKTDIKAAVQALATKVRDTKQDTISGGRVGQVWTSNGTGAPGWANIKAVEPLPIGMVIELSEDQDPNYLGNFDDHFKGFWIEI